MRSKHNRLPNEVSKPAKPPQKEWPEHRMGIRKGYTLYEDGRIQVAPSYEQRMMELTEERMALDRVLAAVTEHIVAQQRKLVQVEQRWWREMCEDYSLDASKHYEYRQGFVRLKPEPEDNKRG